MTRRLVILFSSLSTLAVALVGIAYVLGQEDVGVPGTQSFQTPPPLTVPEAPGEVPSEGPGEVPAEVPGEEVSGDEDGDLDGRNVRVGSSEPAVARLEPELLAALRAAAREAADDGIEVRVSSGWRSQAYQQRLLDEAVVRYGSLDEALRWVATPEASAHVTGDAVDVAATDAAYWMAEHGPEFGLCQSYANEIWHYELLTTPGGTCPPPLPDSAS